MAKNPELFNELKTVVETVEANRGFNYKAETVYKIKAGSVKDGKDSKGKKIKKIVIEFNGIEKLIDVRNLLPFGLKENNVASNQCLGVEVSSLSDILDIICDDEGFRVEFIEKADGFGSAIDDEKKFKDDDIIWGTSRYSRRADSVQLVNFIKVPAVTTA